MTPAAVQELAAALDAQQPVEFQLKLKAEQPGQRHRDTAIVLPSADDVTGYSPDDSFEKYRAQGHSREVAIERVEVELNGYDLQWQPPDAPADIATQGPITAADYEVPSDWIDSAGSTRAANVDRDGEDESIEYFAPLRLVES